jgi:hypothetical protein
MILDEFGLSEKAKVNKIIPKKTIYENSELKKSEQELIKDSVEKIIWEYSLKESNINIEKYVDNGYEYIEVEFFTVIMRTEKNYREIGEILQKTIPYPMVIIFEFKEKIALNCAMKRVNKQDNTKMIIEEKIISEDINVNKISENFYKLLEEINIKKLSFKNFYEFYKGIYDKIVLYNLSCVTGKYDENKSIENINERLKIVEKICSDIEVLKNKMKNEKQSSKKSELVKKIKELNIELEKEKNG